MRARRAPLHWSATATTSVHTIRSWRQRNRSRNRINSKWLNPKENQPATLGDRNVKKYLLIDGSNAIFSCSNSDN